MKSLTTYDRHFCGKSTDFASVLSALQHEELQHFYKHLPEKGEQYHHTVLCNTVYSARLFQWFLFLHSLKCHVKSYKIQNVVIYNEQNVLNIKEDLISFIFCPIEKMVMQTLLKKNPSPPGQGKKIIEPVAFTQPPAVLDRISVWPGPLWPIPMMCMCVQEKE